MPGRPGGRPEDILQVRQPFLGQEERTGLVAGGQGTAQDARGFSDVHAFRGFAELAQVDICELGVVGYPGIPGGLEVVDWHRLIISADWRS